jgi:hypothetical protein
MFAKDVRNALLEIGIDLERGYEMKKVNVMIG